MLHNMLLNMLHRIPFPRGLPASQKETFQTFPGAVNSGGLVCLGAGEFDTRPEVKFAFL